MNVGAAMVGAPLGGAAGGAAGVAFGGAGRLEPFKQLIKQHCGLQFEGDDSVAALGITGDETFDIAGLESGLAPRQHLVLTIRRNDGSEKHVRLLLRADTPVEVDYLYHGGILPFVLRGLLTTE